MGRAGGVSSEEKEVVVVVMVAAVGRQGQALRRKEFLIGGELPNEAGLSVTSGRRLIAIKRTNGEFLSHCRARSSKRKDAECPLLPCP